MNSIIKGFLARTDYENKEVAEILGVPEKTIDALMSIELSDDEQRWLVTKIQARCKDWETITDGISHMIEKGSATND